MCQTSHFEIKNRQTKRQQENSKKTRHKTRELNQA